MNKIAKTYVINSSSIKILSWIQKIYIKILYKKWIIYLIFIKMFLLKNFLAFDSLNNLIIFHRF